MEIRKFCVLEDEEGSRLDVFLSEQMDDMSRSYIQKLIKDGMVKVCGKAEKAKYAVRENDTVEICVPEPKNLSIEPQDMGLDIVHEDDDIIVVNKPQGMVVHPAPGNYDKTLVNGILYHCKGNLSSINGVIRPGIVHRIDKDTSGLLVIAKNNSAHRFLAHQFKEHSIERTYHMICTGSIKQDEFTVDLPIGRNPSNRLKMAVVRGGRNAVTHFHVIERFNGYAHVKANLETGRTHQIRVHVSSVNAPILGDLLYGAKKSRFKLDGQLLHAKTLGFIHPMSKQYVQFDSKLPSHFVNTLEILENNFSI